MVWQHCDGSIEIRVLFPPHMRHNVAVSEAYLQMPDGLLVGSFGCYLHIY